MLGGSQTGPSYSISCDGLAIAPLFQPVDDSDTTCSTLPSYTLFLKRTETAKASVFRVWNFCHVIGPCDDGSFCSNMYEVNVVCSGYDSLRQRSSPLYDSCKSFSVCNAGTLCIISVNSSINICVSYATIWIQTNFSATTDHFAVICMKST